MYFALDVCDPASVYFKLHNKIKHQPELNWMALVDGAFDSQLKRQLPVCDKLKIFDFGEMRQLISASPYIIKLTSDDETSLRREIFMLARHRGNRPMLSFFGSTHSPLEINDHLKRFVNVKSGDGQEFVFRFADTRVLAALPVCLTIESWGGLSELLAEWFYVDRCGNLGTLPVSSAKKQAISSISLSSVEFNLLLKSGEADAIINVISRDHIDLIQNLGGSEFFTKIVEICGFAMKYEVESFRDLVALSIFSLVSLRNICDNEELLSMLRMKNWVEGNLVDNLNNLLE